MKASACSWPHYLAISRIASSEHTAFNSGQTSNMVSISASNDARRASSLLWHRDNSGYHCQMNAFSHEGWYRHYQIGEFISFADWELTASLAPHIFIIVMAHNDAHNRSENSSLSPHLIWRECRRWEELHFSHHSSSRMGWAERSIVYRNTQEIMWESELYES